jgi:hypothetical protein
MLAVAVYIMIRESIVPSSFTGKLAGGHGVLYGAVFCVALVPGIGVSVSRCAEVVWGTAGRESDPHNLC